MWLPFIPTPGTLPAGTLEREWEREGFCVCQRQRPRKIFKLLSNFLHHPYVRLLPSFLHLRDSDSDLLLRHLIQIITTLSLLFHPRPTERKLPLSPITFLISRVLSIIVECLNVHNLHRINPILFGKSHWAARIPCAVPLASSTLYHISDVTVVVTQTQWPLL